MKDTPLNVYLFILCVKIPDTEIDFPDPQRNVKRGWKRMYCKLLRLTSWMDHGSLLTSGNYSH